jgi:hypothetical protein
LQLCFFGWIKGEKPKRLRSRVGTTADEFPITAWKVPSSEVETGMLKGHRLDSRQRESGINRLLTAESEILRCP